MDEEQDEKDSSAQVRPIDIVLPFGQLSDGFANVPYIQGQTGSYTRLLEGVIAMGSQEEKYSEGELETYAGLIDGSVSFDDGLARLLPKQVGISNSMLISSSRLPDDMPDMWKNNSSTTNQEEQGEFQHELNYSYDDIRAEQEVQSLHEYEDTDELNDDDPWNNNLFENMSFDEDNEEETRAATTTTATQSDVCAENPIDQDFQNVIEQDHAEETEDRNAIDEEDIEIFFQNEKLAEEENDQRTKNINTPKVKMQFETREKVQEFFTFYAYLARFSPAVTKVVRTASRKRSGEVISVTMKCNKHGKSKEAEPESVVPKRKSTVIDKKSCPVEMVAKEKNGVWIITSLNLEHNHPPGPLFETKYFKAHKFMSKEEKELIRTLKRTNTPTRKIVETLAFIRGGMKELPYGPKDVANYATKITREVGRNDMMEVVHFFNKKIVENPGFFYAFELDQDNKVQSIFWSDAKSRMQYEEEGDCFSFDTTFLTNRYSLPCAPFVGVSGHGNTILFGCALIVNETANTFKWLFQQFLTAMGGKQPKSIITDQDKAMAAAIREIFPDATHRCCLFHIKKKAEEKIGRCFQANEGLYEELQDIIDNSLIIEEFEMLWQAMIEKFQVHDITYFKDMWDARHKFAPVYFKTDFFPFLQTTARSEGTNSLLKKGVGAKFSVTSFLREYQRIIDVIEDRENACNFHSRNKKVPKHKFWSHFVIERQAHDLYNYGIFKKFQSTLKDTTRLQLTEEEKEKEFLVFQARNYAIKEHRERYYPVSVDLVREEYTCICCRFQKDGILCSHILKVMLHQNIEKIPDKYIIDRWRKKAHKMVVKSLDIGPADNSTLNVLSRRLVKMASNGSQSKRKYEWLLNEIARVEKEMEEVDDDDLEKTEVLSNSTRTVTSMTATAEGAVGISSIQLQNPDEANTKGRKRLKTIREAIKDGTFYPCNYCGEPGHRSTSCEKLRMGPNLPKEKKSRKPQTGKKGSKEGAKARRCKRPPQKP